MSSAEVIDALFERTVDIVQSLPKAGAIQTSYEEKLALYSLYKQATEGDVTSRRPGMLDMLGRAKWDAWSSRRGLSSQDAKQLYVESMLRTLRKFADRPQAIALIEELESYSGDVAQRVMSASLARAGSDSDSDSRPRSPVAMPAPETETDSEDERDAVPQLPPAMASASASRPSSAQATRGGRSVGGGGSGGRRTPQGGSVSGGLPQRYAVPPSRVPRAPLSAASRTPAPLATDSEDSDESLATREERQRRGSQQPSINTPRGAPRAAAYYAGAGPPAPRYATPQSWSRGPGSVTGGGGEGRLYAPPNAPRMPPSESMGGGGGTSMYSAVPPSRAPPSEQHYYHHAGSVRPGAPSSVGARSGGAPSARGAVQPQRAEVDTALQSIQASLAALHERLNRVEERRRSGLSAALFGPSGAGAADGNGGRRGALRKAYGALTDALHDIAVLLGLGAASRTGTAAPSYLASGAGRGNGAGSNGSGAGGLGAPLRLLAAVLNLSVRLALDLTSLALLFSLILFFVQRLTGRGDPLLLLRLMRRWRPRAAAALLPAQQSKRGEAAAVAA